MSGLLYGVFVYLFMNFVVLPLSAVTIASRVSGVLAVVLLIGLTISLLVRWRSRRRPDALAA